MDKESFKIRDSFKAIITIDGHDMHLQISSMLISSLNNFVSSASMAFSKAIFLTSLSHSFILSRAPLSLGAILQTILKSFNANLYFPSEYRAVALRKYLVIGCWKKRSRQNIKIDDYIEFQNRIVIKIDFEE